MINCPKCEADNMVGAIFCRTCGARLNLDELRPESFGEQQDSVGKRIGIMISRILTLGVVFALIGILVAIFLPAGAVVDAEGKFKPTELDHSLAWLMQPTRQYNRFKFTSEKATAMANQALKLNEDQEASGADKVQPVLMSLDFNDDGTIRTVLKQRLFGKVPFYASAVARVVVEDGETKVYIRSASLGRLPMIGGLKNIVIRQFETAFSRSQHAAKLRQSLTSIEVSADEVQLALNPGR